MMVESQIYKTIDITLKYYEVKNNLQPLLLLHAQGVDSLSFEKTFAALSQKYHIYAVDCYGHGGSLHNKERYNLSDIGEAVIEFIENVIKGKVWLLGHSSGGLIAAYIAAESHLCERLILEDPPFFSSQGERRKQTYNFVDLSTVCHNFNTQATSKDFALYYFEHQYAWNFFPEKNREKVREKLVASAAKYRAKHPDKNLKVLFWPKAALSAYQGMNLYDPLFGEAFYDDSFHSDIPHEDILSNVKCKTVFLKAKTTIGKDGLLMAALNEEDLRKVCSLVRDCTVVRFACGHSIHTEKKREFIDCLMKME